MIEIILAEVKEIPLNENGIEHLVLDNGQKLEADLFIDCTGFKSLLLTKAFGVPFISIDKFIPNNYVKMKPKDPLWINNNLCKLIKKQNNQ